MKIVLGLAALVASYTANAAFVNPMDFNGSEGQKQEVIEYIKEKVKSEYCDGAVDMCQPTTLRMMEKQNLAAFKQLTRAKNREVMDRVISDYCDSAVDMCNYVTIDMMYKQNLKASGEALSW
ncbi:hypothetical protein [Mixta gaviniae]|uniref:Uncharacterized protein n=1 Tax=Mixta gaviniae TaxID=665914 RepID=A0A2L0IJR7_9GAMM|nr:hypothetical protein [Mixta gaviniae]AUX94806.1 hypothetical protein C2E15_18175 [Mixta gaviniae]